MLYYTTDSTQSHTHEDGRHIAMANTFRIAALTIALTCIVACGDTIDTTNGDVDATISAGVTEALLALTQSPVPLAPVSTPTPLPPSPPTASPTPTIQPTPTPRPTPTARPTPTPRPTPTARPTSTPRPILGATSTVTPLPTSTIPPTPTPIPIEVINFVGVSASTNVPSQVQVAFSLRNQSENAIARTAEEIERSTRVFERRPATEAWEEIDYAETSYFVHTGENLDLEIVFALDFTESMSQARLPDGRSGIDAMLGGFYSALAVLPAAHRVGVVEFHDRNAEPSVLSQLTTDRQSIRENVDHFSRSGFDPGASVVWDSVVAASDLFSHPSENPRTVRVLVFLSDGHDTSSRATRESAGQYALERGAQLFAVGVGDVKQELQLREMARLTGGAYYRAVDVSKLQSQLQQVVNDLRGQYQLSYITLRKEGNYETRIVVKLQNVEGQTEVGPFDVADFFGADNQGVIDFDPPTIDLRRGQATVFVRALHIPRNIDRIRFRADTSLPLSVDLVGLQDGGLLHDWTLSGPDVNGFYLASSQTPIEFGNFGLLFKLTVSNIPGRGMEIPFDIDNTIYTHGKTVGRAIYITAGEYTPPSRIAFTSNRDGNPEIYTMNADGADVKRLTNNPERDVSPSWSPDGHRIAFVSYRDGVGEVYVMNADGTNLHRLTNSSNHKEDIAWSPNGIRIAFASEREGNRDIYVMNADGSGVRPLTNHPSSDASPSWSPDGRQIAFESEREGNRDIYVMNADGSDARPLTNHPSDDASPSWSPDGRQIAFESEREGNRDIYVMNADGSSDAKRLTSHSAGSWFPSWSPDGRRIAFVSDPRDYGIYVMRPDGSGLAKLAASLLWDSPPAWTIPDPTKTLPTPTATSTPVPTDTPTPTATSMSVPAATPTPTATSTPVPTDTPTPTPTAISTSTPTPTMTPTATPTPQPFQRGRIAFASNRDGISDIYVINADGTGLRRVTSHPEWDHAPAWSPDGNRIAFMSFRHDNWEIYVMNANGTGVTRLTNRPEGDFAPAWSPDGKRIAFESYQAGEDNKDIYVMNADGTDVTRLTNNRAWDGSPTWSPDGQRIAFMSERDGNGDIYVMNADGTGVTRVTSNGAWDEAPSWLPTAPRIVFHTERDGNKEIYVINASGSGVTRLTDRLEADTNPAWSSDGWGIAFESETADGDRDIYVMGRDGSNPVQLTDGEWNDESPSWWVGE